MQIITDIPKHHYEVFGSLGEFAKYALANEAPKSSNKAETFDDGVSWQGDTKTLTEACDVARNGYGAIRSDVDSILDKVTERLDMKFSEHYVTEYATSGSSVDMGRFVTGEPECMLEFLPESSATMGRVVKIIIAGTASASISASHIIARGVAVVALLETIHKMGVGVELWWESCIEGNDGRAYSTVVKLHDSNDHLDIDSVMFSMAHPAMLRRLTFSVQEQSATASEQRATSVGSGYGYPHDMAYTKIQDYDVVVEKLQDGRGDIVKDPFAWVLTTVQGLGLAE